MERVHAQVEVEVEGWGRDESEHLTPLLPQVYAGFEVGSRCRHNGQGGYSTGFFKMWFWTWFGEVLIIKLVQTLSKTYLGGTRDRF